MSAKGLNIRWEGYERAEVRRTEEKGNVYDRKDSGAIYSSERSFFDQVIVLHQAPNGVLDAGHFSANFEFQLPLMCDIVDAFIVY